MKQIIWFSLCALSGWLSTAMFWLEWLIPVVIAQIWMWILLAFND